jgi:hypothetical protein
MPRDVETTLLLDSPFDAWTRLGLIPVSPEFVKQHKRDFREKHSRPGHGDRWRITKYKGENLDHALATYSVIVRTFDSFSCRHDHARVANPAPRELVDLALRVLEQHPEAKFDVERFHLDPILNATLDGQKGCLGIWDMGELIAIATKIV